MSSPVRRVLAHVAIAAFALLLLAGCGRTVDPPEPVSLHILGEASYLLQARGETVSLSAELRFADGSVSPTDDVTWTSDDARVEVASDGTVTARDDVGSAKIRAEYGQLVSDPVEVYVVQTAANTRILTEGVVEVAAPVSETAVGATLASTAATDALAIGDIIVTNDGLFGRIEQLVRTGSGVEVVVELVPLREAFDRIDIGMESEAVELAAVISPDGIEVRNLSDPRAPVERLAPDALKCETEAGVAVVGVTGGRVEVGLDLRVVARYRYDSATDTEFFELYAQGVPSITAESLVLETAFGPNAQIDCTVSLRKLTMPVASFWGILTIGGILEPKAGFRIEAAAQMGKVKIQGPYVKDARLEFEAGIRHSQAGWEGLGGGPNPIRARVAVDDYGWGSYSVDDGLSLSLAIGPILKVETGATFQITLFSVADVFFLDPTLYLRAGLDIPNVDPDARDYAGATLSMALVGESSIKFDLGGGLGRALRVLGINVGFELAKAGFQLGTVLEAPPPELTASRSLVDDASGVTFTARDPGRRADRVFTFQAFDDDGNGTRIGTATTGANGAASFTWFPTAAFNGRQHVRGLLDVRLGFPIVTEQTLVLTVDVRGSASDPPAISNLVPAQLDLTVVDLAAELPTRSESVSVTFGNVGGGTLTFELRLDPPAPRWLVIDSPTTGTLGFGASTQAELTATCVDGVGTFEARLVVSSNDVLRPELATDVTLSCSETLPLTVEIERPIAGDIVSSNVLVEGTLTHEGPVTALSYRVGSRLPEDAMAGLQDGRFSFSIPSDRFVSIEGGPTENIIVVEAVDDLGAAGSASVTVIFDPATAPAAGRDVVVFNDINLFDDGALSVNANNTRLIENLIDFSDSGEREVGTVIWFDRGRNSQCFVENFCRDEQLSRMRKVIEDRGYSLVDANSTLGSITGVPADVKVIFLWNPRVAYTAAEINVLKKFSGEGGRIVFIGEHANYYGPSIPLQNQFLADMGALMRNAGEAVDCGYTLLPGASLRSHQITEGLSNLTIACASVVELGPNDFPLFYDTTNTKVLAAVAAVDVTPITVSSARVWGLAPAMEYRAPDPSVTSHGTPHGTPHETPPP